MGLAFSIVGVDTARGLIGASGGVCAGDKVPNIVQASYNHIPGKAVLVTNALAIQDGSNAWLTAQVEMGKGTNPSQILTAITEPAVDTEYKGRQYGLVDFQGRAAGYTGQDVPSPKLDTQGTFSSFAFSAQGEVLYGTDTVTSMADAFQNGGEGCDDLVDRLFLAMKTVSGVNKGQDAVDCPQGATILFLRVDHSNGAKVVELFVDYVAGQDPFPKLEEQYQAWRANNPCGSCVAQDACSPSYLLFNGFQMHAPFPFFGTCWALCVPWFLVGLSGLLGWECNACPLN